MPNPQLPTEFVERLNHASARKRFYPFDDDVIDWSIPLDSKYLYMPPEYSFLSGTKIWDELAPQERSFVTRWEITQMMRNAGLGEHLLNQGALRLLWRTDQYDPTWRYLLHEVAEECQHMAMFNAWVMLNRDIRTVGLASKVAAQLAARFAPTLAVSQPELFWVYVLLFEAVGDDTFQALSKNSCGLIHPILQQLGRVHVVEEARHIAFALKWLEKGVPRLSKARRRILHDGTALALAGLERVPRLFPLFYADQLVPHMTRREFTQAIRSDQSREVHLTRIGEVVKLLERVGAVRATTASSWNARKVACAA